jgi:ABC-type Mn2+/Zn2+ transport system permease subunit
MMLAAVNIPSLAALGALALACALLSVVVVLRNWAFIGEGIAHAGFGGAGTAWILSLLLPGVGLFHDPSGVFTIAVLFCLMLALGIATITRRGLVHADTAIGIFLVLSMAWGFLAQAIYVQQRKEQPPDFFTYLWGRLADLPPAFLIGSVCACLAVVLVLALLRREILCYCLDPVLAECSGVRAGLIHYVLILLVAVTMVVGMRILGSILAIALLILPGASALLLTRSLARVVAGAVGVALLGTAGGATIHACWTFIPNGPAVVICLVALFAGCYAWRVLQRGRAV